MTWYAFDEVEEAAQKTKNILLPFELGTWARLALLVIFTGSGMSVPNFPSGNYGDTGHEGDFNTGDASTQLQQNPDVAKVMDQASGAPLTGAFSEEDVAVSAAVIGAGITIGILILLLFMLSSVFQFVYYQSLIDDRVKIRSNFRKHLRDGIRYMAFRFVALIFMIFLVGAGALGLVANPLLGIFSLLAVMIFLIPVMIILGLINNFVIPETIKTDQSFWRSLRTGLNKAKSEWRQTGIYIITRLGIKMFIGVVSLLYALTVLLVLLIPFGILGFLAYMLSPIVAVIPAIIGVLVFLVALIGAQVVTQTYLNYFALGVFDNFE